MGVDVTTMLMLGIKFERDEIPDSLLECYCDEDYVIHNNPKVRIVITNSWGDPCDIVIGYELGELDETENTIFEDVAVMNEDLVVEIQEIIHQFLIDNQIDSSRKSVKLLMFNQFS